MGDFFKNKPTPEQIERNREWIKDLRSGKYNRTQEKLRNKGKGRCCLGVACETFKRLTGTGKWKRDGDSSELGFCADTYISEAFPPNEVAEFFGWDDENPHLEVIKADYFGKKGLSSFDDPDGLVGSSASDINDSGKNINFNKIADAVERALENECGTGKA